MTRNPSQVAVVLLNYNGAQDTLECIESLFSLTIGFRQLIVCDNASTDDSFALLTSELVDRRERYSVTWKAWGNASAFSIGCLSRKDVIDNAHPDSPLVIVDNQKNWGFAGGNNVGLRLALSNSEISHVWLLNNDTRVDANALDALLASAENRPAVGLWGATVLYDEPAGQVQALGGGALNRITAETRHLCAFTPAEEVPDNPQFIRKIEAEMAYVLGASMFATRAWLETVGLLDERYFLYYEELDWAERGRPHFALGYARDCIVVHKEGASIGTAPGGGSALSVHHLHRSRFLFARRFFTRAGIPGVIVGSLKQQMKYVLRGNFRLAKAATTGMFDGLRQRSVV